MLRESHGITIIFLWREFHLVGDLLLRFLYDSKKKMESFPPPDKKKHTEINKHRNARRDPAERNPHFSLTIEVKKDHQSRLELIKQRINNTKSALGIDRKTSTMQNADLMERLLSCFEMIHPSAVESSSSSIAKADVLQAPITAPSQPVQPSSSSVEVPVQQHARKRQIYVESTVDDGSYLCTKSSLQALCKYSGRYMSIKVDHRKRSR